MTERPVTEVRILRAGSVGTDVVPDLIIRTVNEPTDAWTVDQAQDVYVAQGEQIAEAILNHCPGGVVDQLLAALLLRRASLLRVRLAV